MVDNSSWLGTERVDPGETFRLSVIVKGEGKIGE